MICKLLNQFEENDLTQIYILQTTEEVEVIAVPKNAVASGNCTVGSLNLTWPSNLSANATKKNDTIRFTFKADEKAQTWKLDSIQGEVITKTEEKIREWFLTVFFLSLARFQNPSARQSYYQNPKWMLPRI